ncbi:MAG TPA: hypothetical protein VM096_11280 [Vicinamibacterales bacterium]|nr:hypothetical protein [Vicinamibacterales bacterium]
MASLGQSTAAGSTEQQFERVFAKFNTVAPPSYRAFRRLEGGVANSDKNGWLEAWTEYTPGGGFSFNVVNEGGSDYVRNKVLRGMLTSEQQLIAAGKRVRTSLDAKNYTFEDGGITESGLHRILMVPSKKSDGLVDGSVYLDPESGLVTRIQGRLVKSPSFWVRDVDVAWKFAHVAGHVVPVEMTSTGRVRMFGRSSFRMVYDYVSIDGRSTGAGLRAALREEQP